MASVSEVKRWNAAALNEIAATMQQREQVLINSGDDFGKIMPVDGWTGGAADDAGSAHRLLHFRIDKMAAGASVVHKALMQASDAIPAVQNAIHAAENLAEKYGFKVGDGGQLTDAWAGKALPQDMHPEDRARAQQQIIDDVAQALRTADDIDNDLTSVLRRAAQGEFGTGDEATVAAAAAAAESGNPGLTLPEPPPNASPSQNAAWWASLSSAGQSILLRDHPDWLGNRDGLPGAVRSQANVARLPAERAALERLHTAAQAVVDQTKSVYDPSGNLMANALRNLDQIDRKLRSLDAIDAAMAHGGRQLLTLDTSGERVKAAVGVGNIDTAEHVAVFTPGFTSTVDRSLHGYDQDMNNLQQHSQNLASRYGDHGQVATVTWIGYETPQTADVLNPDKSVASDGLAKIGAQKLDGFLNGVGAAHNASGQPLHLTALGHSYGSLTTGIALQHDTPVKDAVVFGSPGLDISNRNDLKVPEGHMFSEWSDQDPVPRLDIAHNFGTSPYQGISGGVLNDIQQLSTGDATGADGPHHITHEHGQYLDENSTSQYNMASVVAGRPDLAVRHVQPWEMPVPPPVPGDPIPAPPGRDPQPPPR
ncbi:alpha/beta hydrolase family protein [Amycolatopsis echigonensis]|uniref:Alpha/beta hydrolase family protein n=1 Tax=Amycolatopsis echigonensis TaxID=2576905 RepID=A0A2N3WJR1_9PSEU|nr:alpha/beta hydrolase [Amycolatopsis niigatensis]PKV94086.1 alpha/beta hydrolase family protein [Amycolatopsis niigatensis]